MTELPSRPEPGKAQEFEHGTLSAYKNHHCRCKPCQTANADHAYRRRRERRAMLASQPVHGTESTYSNWMCRCDACRLAGANARRRRQPRKGDAS